MEAELEVKDRELTKLQKITHCLHPAEADKMPLQEDFVQLTEEQNIATTNLNSGSIPKESKAIQFSVEDKIKELNEEKSLIQTKLQDRDTTIATLLRQSIILENKIESQEAELELESSDGFAGRNRFFFTMCIDTR